MGVGINPTWHYKLASCINRLCIMRFEIDTDLCDLFAFDQDKQ